MTDPAGSMPGHRLLDFLLLMLVVVSSDAGIFTEADGILVAAAIGILRPVLLPYLVLLVAGFQDARGLSGIWWYGGTVGLGLWVTLTRLPAFTAFLKGSERAFRALVALVVVTVIYSVLSSYIQDSLGIHPQATTREPYVVGALALLMSLIGMTCYFAMRRDADAPHRVIMIVVLVLVNGLIVSAARMALGYDHFLSAAGVAQLEDAQLVEDTPLGFPRLTGSYLTPIGFAMYIAYLLVLWEAITTRRGVSGWFVMLYVVIAIMLSVMSLSKGMAAYFLVTIGVILVARPRYILPFALGAFGVSLWVINLVGLDAVSEAFRFEQGTSTTSYRAIAWAATISKFSWSDWLFGTGIAYWPTFLERNAGFALSDPHNYLLSIPGTYGILGIALYLVLAGCIVSAFRAGHGYSRVAAASLFVMFFVADAVNIPYVIGNTPITACIWAAITALCAQRSAPSG